jgi:hypothetical protein
MATIQKAHEILPGLWLGSAAAAQDEEFLRRERIHAVFNFTKDLGFSQSVPTTKYRIAVDDNLHPEEIRNMELWAPDFTVKMINEWYKGPILIHCYAGVQRSAAAVAMFMIRWLHLKAADAVAYIKQIRPVAFRPAVNFQAAILGYERQLAAEAYRGLINDD